MDPSELEKEASRLARSWDQYDAGMLEGYLVEDVEDPRLNAQSILSRHFLVEALFGGQFVEIEQAELKFSVAMNWLLKLDKRGVDPEDREVIAYALSQGADNAEGFEIPEYVLALFRDLPARVQGVAVPNYFLEGLRAGLRSADAAPDAGPKGAFVRIWREALAGESTDRPLRVLEPACGSANDFRFIEACGLASFLEYTGVDISEKNIRNARALFPNVRFETANAFDLPFEDRAFDCVFVHDLFEHLSLAALKRALRETCRVARMAVSASFFNMDEIPEHAIQPVDEYHWNLLSLEEVRAFMGRQGFEVQAIHIRSMLEWLCGCKETHNEGAYTLMARRPVDE